MIFAKASAQLVVGENGNVAVGIEPTTDISSTFSVNHVGSSNYDVYLRSEDSNRYSTLTVSRVAPLTMAANNGKTNVSDCLDQFLPYEFVGWNGLTEGVDVWFKAHWCGVPCGQENTYQALDSIRGDRFYVSLHYDAKEEPSAYGYHDEPSLCLGQLKAGKYIICLAVVEDGSHKKTYEPMEISFCVEPATTQAYRGIVPADAYDYRDKQFDDPEKPDDNTCQPHLDVTRERDTLHITGHIYSACCAEHFIYYEMQDDTIFLHVVDAGSECDCMDYHKVEFSISPYSIRYETVTLVSEADEWGQPWSRRYEFGHPSNGSDKPEGISAKLTEDSPNCYDLTGRRVTRGGKGIYIVGGRKRMLK